MKLCGIYMILHKPSGRKYIGSSVDIRKRWNLHKSQLRKGIHHSPFLQRAWNKYGEESFEFIVLAIEADPKKLTQIEQIWLDYHKPEFNVCKTAGSPLGVKHSEQTKTKHRKPHSKERKEKISNSLKGRKQSDETKEKIKKALLGKKHSDEHRRKNSEAKNGTSNWVGRKHTEASKEKMREAARRREEKKRQQNKMTKGRK